MKYEATIEWPNHLGYTPCTVEYRDVMMARDTIYDSYFDEGLTYEDMTPEDYQEWSVLCHRLDQLQASGHLGESIRY
jgi:hypothetical protein